VWLRANKYDDIADLIDGFMKRWVAKGKTTRRNWWETLSGGVAGRPYSIDGTELPVLAAAQRRQGKPVTDNAIQRNLAEDPPPARETKRWK